MICKNQYKESGNTAQQDKLFYQRIKESPRIGFVFFNTPFDDKKKQQRCKKSQTGGSVYLRMPCRQKPKRIYDKKAEKKTATEYKNECTDFKKECLVAGKHFVKIFFHALNLLCCK